MKFKNLVENKENIKLTSYAIFSYFFILIVNGAIPFYSSPTLGQAVWASGFAESFANQNLAIFANNFGIPEKSPIAFGLPGAVLQSLYIYLLNLHAIDAYTLTIASFLLVAFIGILKLSQYFGASYTLSIFMTTAYLTLPIVWWHSVFSFLQVGFALLPLYMYYGFRLSLDNCNLKLKVILAFKFCLLAVVAICMDGYTFMMFAVGTILFYLSINYKKLLKLNKSIFINLLLIFISFAIAYFLYTLYLGTSSFEVWPIDYFRGFGVDLVMLLQPSHGIHWMWDLLGFSDLRSGKYFFGDASVWSVSFSLPLILLAIVAFFLTQSKLKYPLLLIALTSFYFALGPSLKINSTRTAVEIENKNFNHAMKEEYAVAKTGNEIFYKYLPGFKSMRTTYRWIVLFQFSLWALIVLGLLSLDKRDQKNIVYFVVIFIILNNIPNLSKHISQAVKNRNSVFQMDKEVVSLITSNIEKNSKVAFLPWHNDHFVNYLAAKSEIKTYNIGGDKNLELAKKNWPDTMLAFLQIRPGKSFIYNIENILVSKDADYVVFPYFDLLWGAYSWPRKESEIISRKNMYSKYISYFERSEYFNTVNTEFMFIISLNNKVNLSQLLDRLKNEKLCNSNDAICFDASKDKIFTQVGDFESNYIKSKGISGALLYGPYQPISKGKYSLKIYGENTKKTDFKVQIVHDLGRKVLYELNSSETTKNLNKEEIVFYFDELNISEDIENLEIKIIVDDKTDIKIYKYKLTKEQSI